METNGVKELDLKLQTLKIAEQSSNKPNDFVVLKPHHETEKPFSLGTLPKNNYSIKSNNIIPNNPQETMVYLQKELQKKKIILKTAKINLLPDGGEKIKSQISSLEAQIEKLQSKENIVGNAGMVAQISQKQIAKSVPNTNPVTTQERADRFFHVKGSNGQTTLIKVTQAGPNQKQNAAINPTATYKLPALNEVHKPNPAVQNNYVVLKQHPSSFTKLHEKVQQHHSYDAKPQLYQRSGSTIPVQAQALPLHILKQMYRSHPQAQTLYGGRMTEAQKNEAKLVTSEAIEKLHHSIQTCPSEKEKASDPKGLRVSLLPHQKHALTWMLWRETQEPHGGILADDMGLGKTLTALALILKSQELESVDAKSETEEHKNLILTKTTLIVCPASVLHQWAKEADDRIISGRLKVLLFHGPNREKDPKKFLDYDVVLTTFNIIVNEIGSETKEVSKESETSKAEAVGSPRKRMGAPFLDVVWKRVILDEAHTIKNPKSQTAVALCKLRTKYRWAITGTPLHNDLMDMYSLLRFLRCSPFDELKVWKKWVDNKSLDGQKRLNTLIKSLMLRRTKNQMGDMGEPLVHLPSKESQTITIELSPEERKVYEKIFEFSRCTLMNYLKHQQMKKDNLVENISTEKEVLPFQHNKPNVIRSSDILVLLLRLRQCCSHMNLIKSKLDVDTRASEGIEDNFVDQFAGMSLSESKPSNEPKELKSLMAELSSNNELFEILYPSTKIVNLINKLKEVHSKDTGSKVKSVIVSQWTSMLDIIGCHLKKEKFRHHLIQGDIPPKKRAALVDDFNSNPEGPEIMLISLRAGGVGLNLIGGSHLFLVDMHWNPQLELQACDRIHRVGQKHNVYIYRFFCKNTVEEKILSFQQKKLQLASNIYVGAKDKKQKLTLDDIKSLFNIQRIAS